MFFNNVSSKFIKNSTSSDIFRTFKIFDDDGSRSLDFKEFTKGLRDYGLVVDATVVKQLFTELDKDGSNSVDFDEFLEALRVS